MPHKEITFDRFIRGLITIGCITAAVLVLNHLSSVLLPFFVAWLLAYMLYPLVTFFQNKLHLHNRVISIVLALLTVLALIVGAFWLIIPPTIAEFLRLRDVIEQFIGQYVSNTELANAARSFLKEHIEQNIIVQHIQEGNLVEALRVGMGQMWGLVSHTVNFTVGILGSFLMLMYLFFILLDYETISYGWLKLIPAPRRAFAVMLADDVKTGMNAYFRGQALVALLVGILFSIGFLIIDFPLAIGLGLFIGMLNLVPYLQVVGFIPTVLLALLKAANTGENFWFILLCALLVFVIVQIIQDMILVPRIMGKLMGLNPAIILLSLSVWGSLLGIIGLIIALPLTTLMLSYYRRFIIGTEPITPSPEGEDFPRERKRNSRREKSRQTTVNFQAPNPIAEAVNTEKESESDEKKKRRRHKRRRGGRNTTSSEKATTEV